MRSSTIVQSIPGTSHVELPEVRRWRRHRCQDLIMPLAYVSLAWNRPANQDAILVRRDPRKDCVPQDCDRQKHRKTINAGWLYVPTRTSGTRDKMSTYQRKRDQAQTTGGRGSRDPRAKRSNGRLTCRAAQRESANRSLNDYEKNE